ncbi:unnamed protein product [Vitrella brassicaformis CCMP3155]|uniref:Uncharacterized protein n=1 Tax=Vitrella brassicaformis (strain CCMP3155) TaxID=1169540 RepID=A0A0G4GXR5_VITBC|nr:unnamed protein product [Vitrella brassicaformis CCMP3155]|mmetsp:Transcript_7790/g.19179  ORF Transcript_7790/g.19179 Transcript_7790/m.19179 type:complete len:210 (+) Transcript_7790:68-697(+)|eukprot:CEM35644.1 unnamed protein product [Vitrella brassicaformis CCMP3155]
MIRLSKPRLLLASTTHYLRRKYWILCWSLTDPMVVDYFFEKFMRWQYYDVPSYNYMFAGALGIGICSACYFRVSFFCPQVSVRRSDRHKALPDQHRTHAHALPYFNHHLRNWVLKWRASLIDNEPDFQGDHPWGIRPPRQMGYQRCPWFLPFPYQYIMNVPHYERTTHAAMEEYYERIGYYGKTRYRFGIHHDQQEGEGLPEPDEEELE